MRPRKSRRVANAEGGRAVAHQAFSASRRFQPHGHVKETWHGERFAIGAVTSASTAIWSGSKGLSYVAAMSAFSSTGEKAATVFVLRFTPRSSSGRPLGELQALDALASPLAHIRLQVLCGIEIVADREPDALAGRQPAAARPWPGERRRVYSISGCPGIAPQRHEE